MNDYTDGLLLGLVAIEDREQELLVCLTSRLGCEDPYNTPIL